MYPRKLVGCLIQMNYFSFMRKQHSKKSDAFELNTQQVFEGVKNQFGIAIGPDPFFMRALILQAITPCAKKVV